MVTTYFIFSILFYIEIFAFALGPNVAI